MSKVSNCIRMLILLKSRGKMKIKELSEILEVSERMVREYKNELEKARIYIQSDTGVYGGYYLDDNSFLFNLTLDEIELSSLINAREFLKKEDNFMLYSEYQNALDKINASIELNLNKTENEHIFTHSIPNINLNTEKRKFRVSPFF